MHLFALWYYYSILQAYRSCKGIMTFTFITYILTCKPIYKSTIASFLHVWTCVQASLVVLYD